VAHARAAMLVAAAAAGVPALDTPWPDPRDPEGLAREAACAAEDGFAGKLCIHPGQIEAVNAAFTPSAERLAWARRVRDGFAANPGAGVFALDGKMIDRPHLKLVVCCWNLMAGAEQPEELKQQTAADAALASLQACVDQVCVWIRRAEVRDATPQVVSETEPTRAASLPMIGLAASRRQELDLASKKIAQAFDVPIALVSFADGPSQEAQEGHDNSLDAHVIAADDVLVSEDVTEDARFADDPRVLEKGIRFYAGAPLRTSSGQVVGCLSLVDTQPRKLPEQDRVRLQDMANGLMVDFNSKPNDAEVQAAALRPYNASG